MSDSVQVDIRSELAAAIRENRVADAQSLRKQMFGALTQELRDRLQEGIEHQRQATAMRRAMDQMTLEKQQRMEALPGRVDALERKVDRLLVLLGDGQTCVDRLGG